MSDIYKATKTRSGRPGWSVIFGHPLRRDARGKFGLKIRRGLNTNDDERADELVSELNTLLSDRRWWSADRRSDAEAHGFSGQVISAFFDGIEVGRTDTRQLREAKIRLPGRTDGYARVLFVGTFAAGKTTLLRQMIGSSHERDSFPATSAGRTTTADTEIITSEGSFDAVVTFMSEFELRALLDECIEAACLAAIDGKSDEKIAAALLTHHEQRFRLFHILGEMDPNEEAGQDDFAFDGPESTTRHVLDETDRIADQERKANAGRLLGYVGRIKALASGISAETAEHLGALEAQPSQDDKAAWLESYSDELFKSEELVTLALDIKDAIEDRFASVAHGLERSPTGWPLVWSFSTDDRGTFLHEIRRFSGNHALDFGRLLTPLVDGVRVRGPWRSGLTELQNPERLVLLDGEGLGHKAEAVSSISTAVTSRFADVDLILLVDSAQQPMQAAPIALFRAVGTAGYSEKLVVAFSKFDLVKGDNLQSLAQKRNHVFASITNALKSLRQILGAPVAADLERRLEHRVFFVGGLDRERQAIPPGVVRELGRLLDLFRAAALPVKPVEAAPIYAPSGLETALLKAVECFLQPWKARLRDEHFSRIKALSRRFVSGGDHYDTLMPASDFIDSLQTEISRWLESPADWTRQPADDDERIDAIKRVRNAVYSALHELAKFRLGDQHREDWRSAYNHSGGGSARRRAHEITRIYEESAPPLSSAMTPAARAFLTDVLRIVQNAVVDSGGRFEISRAA